MTTSSIPAVILAAGCGTRLRSVVNDRPKGLLQLDGITPVGRSISLLHKKGIREIIIVAGHQSGCYHRLAEAIPGVTVVENSAFASTGSMFSLHSALEHIKRDFLLLESDLLFEERALDAVLAHHTGNALLASGLTGATDEVWVDAPNLRLRALSKNRLNLNNIVGEFVGICRISAELADEMNHALTNFVRLNQHARMDYETDALVEACVRFPVDVVLVPDLVWGEIDHDFHYARITARVWPEILKKDSV